MRSLIVNLAEKTNKLSLPVLSRIVFLLGFLLIIFLWILIYYQTSYDYARTIEENSNETMNIAIAFEEHALSIFSEMDKDLLYLKQAYEQGGTSSPVFNSYWDVMVNNPNRTQILVLNEHGDVIKSAHQPPKPNLSDREYFQEHSSNGNHNLNIGKTIKGVYSGRQVIPMSRRVSKADGTFGGVVVILLRTDYFLSFYNKMDIGQNQLISLNGMDGFNRTRQTNDDAESGQDIRASELWKRVQAGQVVGTHISTNAIDGFHRLNSFRVIPEYRVVVAVGKSTQCVLKEYQNRKGIYTIVGLVASLCILAYCSLFIAWYGQQRTLNKEISRLERLNLVGEMAAGIGHEVRNPLTTVRGYLQWFQRKTGFSAYQEQLTTMIEEIDRANSIITEFLSLAKDKSVVLKQGNLNDVLDALSPLLQAEAYHLGYGLKIEKIDIPDNWFDDSQVRQMLLNLARNGFEAMEPGNTLTIKSYTEGNQNIVAVCDVGKGIPQNIIDKIGTPFVTTKDTGTGLGLAVCYRIADRHNAKIEFETSEKGTTFYVKFGLEKAD